MPYDEYLNPDGTVHRVEHTQPAFDEFIDPDGTLHRVPRAANAQVEYLPPRSPYARNANELRTLRDEAEELRLLLAAEASAGRELRPPNMNARARLETVEREIAQAEAVARGGVTRAADHTPCGLRSRQGTIDEARALLQEIEALERRTALAGQACKPPARQARSAAPQDYADPVPYWIEKPGASPALAANTAGPKPAALAANTGGSFAQRWAQVYEAAHPGEAAFAA